MKIIAIDKGTGEVVPELSNEESLKKGLEGAYKDVNAALEYFYEYGDINTTFILYKLEKGSQ